jgi:hypothetical protein
VHGAAGASPEQQLRRYAYSSAGGVHSDTLLTSGGLDAALARELGARPVRALWSPYNGTRAEIGTLAIVNSEEAGDRGRGQWPLHVLAQLQLHRGGRALRVGAVLEFDNATAPVRVRVVRVMLRPELQGVALALAYAAAPLRVHAQHANVLAVAGRVLAVHMHSTTLQLVFDVAEFGCFECEAHERWDPTAQRCACLPGSLAACLPCIEGSACDPHRAVYSPDGAGCVVLNGVEDAVYEERCLPCGVGAPFYCPDERARACEDGEFAHTASGLAPGVDACRCAPGRTRGADGGCVPCAAAGVCAPALSARGLEFECPENTELDATQPPVFACQCRPGLLELGSHEWVVERDARWPVVERATGEGVGAHDEVLLRKDHASVRITVAACGPCPPGRYCQRGRGFACEHSQQPRAGQTGCECADGFKPGGVPGTCAACAAEQVCVRGRGGIAVHECGGLDPAPNATGHAALCPCASRGGRARVFHPGVGCLQCREGHFCPPPALLAPRERHREVPCPPNSTAPKGSSSLHDCACQAGMHLVDGGCALCPPDTFSRGGAEGCVDCPGNATAPEGSTDFWACQCREHQEIRSPEGCVCRDTLPADDRECRPCDNPRAEMPAPDGTDTSRCTHCKPGFWRTTSDNVRIYACAQRTHDVEAHPYAREARAAWRQYDAMYGARAAGGEGCVLCPPGYACRGGRSAPVAQNRSAHSYQLVPAGLRSHAAGWRACPDMRSHSAPRVLSTVGFGSCVLEADTWGAQAQPPHVAALGSFGAAGALTVDTQVHTTRLLNMLLDARTVPPDSDPKLDYVNPAIEIAWSRESPTRFVFYFEIDVVSLAYDYHDELHAVVEALGAHDDDTGAAAAALLPAIWALHHVRAHSAARIADFFVPVTSLVHNELSDSAVQGVLAHAARHMRAAALPQVRFLVAQTQLVARDASAYLAERGGLAYVRVHSATAVTLAQYAAEVSHQQAAALSEYRLPAVAPILQDVLRPSLDIACPVGTTSASEQGARACAGCGVHEWYDASLQACARCSSHPMLMCSPGLSQFKEPLECSWQRDGSCSACPPQGCCDELLHGMQQVAQLLEQLPQVF